VKDLKKQMSKSGANKRGKVHTVDIMHRDSNVGKGDRSQQIERGRNFIQAIKDTPKHLKKAGAKKGDTVIGKPTAVMPGEDKKTGEAKRAKLYKRIFGKRSQKVFSQNRTYDWKSGVMKTLNQFLYEASAPQRLKIATAKLDCKTSKEFRI
jgi:hypothetical protein